MTIPDSALEEIMFAAARGNPVLQNDMVYRECIARALATAANQAERLGVSDATRYFEAVSQKLVTTVPQG